MDQMEKLIVATEKKTEAATLARLAAEEAKQRHEVAIEAAQKAQRASENMMAEVGLLVAEVILKVKIDEEVAFSLKMLLQTVSTLVSSDEKEKLQDQLNKLSLIMAGKDINITAKGGDSDTNITGTDGNVSVKQDIKSGN